MTKRLRPTRLGGVASALLFGVWLASLVPLASTTWPDVAVVIINQAPMMTTAIASLLAGYWAYRSKQHSKANGDQIVGAIASTEQNAHAIEEVHKIVNSRFTDVVEQLEAALDTIAQITGQPRVDAKDAPYRPRDGGHP